MVFCHLGDEKEQLDLLSEVIENTKLLASLFLPTHINRNPSLITAGVKFEKSGGLIDFTTGSNRRLLDDGEVACAEALVRSLEAGTLIISRLAQMRIPSYFPSTRWDSWLVLIAAVSIVWLAQFAKPFKSAVSHFPPHFGV